MSGELPDGWTCCRADEICGSVRDGTHDTPRYVEDGVPLVTSKHLRGGTIDLSTTKKISEEDHAEISKRSAVDVGDVLFAMIGTIGNAVLVTHPPHYSIKNLALFKSNPGYLESSYMHRWLSSTTYLSWLSPQLKGTSQKFAPLGLLRESQVPLPPFNEQKRIVAKIDALTEKSRAAREALDEVPALLDQLRQSILAAAFRGDLTKKWREQNPNVEPASVLLDRIRKERRRKWEEAELAKFQAKGKVPKGDDWKSKYKEPEPVNTEGLPELPEGWCWGHIEEFLSLARTGMKTGPFGTLLGKHDYISDGIPIIGIENIGQMRFIEGSKNHISKAKADSLAGYDAVENDLLISRSGTVGEVCVVPANLGRAIISTNVIRIALEAGRLLPKFLGLTFTGSPLVLAQIKDLCAGSSRDFLNQGIMSKLRLPIPPVEEQEEIISRIGDLDDYLRGVTRTFRSTSDHLGRLDASILAKAFRGELVPQDPNEEPASVLLERIRQEREGGGEKKTRGKKTP